MKVMKFGGAAVADAAGMQRVAEIVAKTNGPRVVVTSAMRGVTDRLQAAMARGMLDEPGVLLLVDELRQRHRAALAAIAPDGNAAAQYALDTTLERLERLLYGIAYTQEVTPRLHDLVLTFGERLAAPLVAAALQQAGCQARALDAEHAGVASLGPFGNARPDLPNLRDGVQANLLPMTAAGDVPVVTGFYGVDANGDATLFGRGGSDYVAALLGYALDADAVELWKDVAGFLTADPRSVPHARLVDRMDYEEAAELANVGAKVLHARCVEPVQGVGIPIHIRCFATPDAPGTIIDSKATAAPALVRSAACRDRLGIIRIHGPGMAHTPGVAKRVFDALSEAEVNVLNMATSQATFAILLLDEDLERARDALNPLLGGVIQDIETLPGRALVCVVGKGLGQQPGSAANILGAVAQADVNIEMISLGASDLAIDFIVHSQHVGAALRAIHDRFLNGNAKTTETKAEATT